MRTKDYHLSCRHKTRRDRCVRCPGATQVCRHNRRKSRCSTCGGCKKHGRRTDRCRECFPTSWAKAMLRCATTTARARGYKPPHITPERYLALPEEFCCLCTAPLFKEQKRRSPLHHNHKTGKVIGYAHAFCNKVEGQIMMVSRPKLFLRAVLTECE